MSVSFNPLVIIYPQKCLIKSSRSILTTLETSDFIICDWDIYTLIYQPAGFMSTIFMIYHFFMRVVLNYQYIICIDIFFNLCLIQWYMTMKKKCYSNYILQYCHDLTIISIILKVSRICRMEISSYFFSGL